jgi:hypothetical protein
MDADLVVSFAVIGALSAAVAIGSRSWSGAI